MHLKKHVPTTLESGNFQCDFAFFGPLTLTNPLKQPVPSRKHCPKLSSPAKRQMYDRKWGCRIWWQCGWLHVNQKVYWDSRRKLTAAMGDLTPEPSKLDPLQYAQTNCNENPRRLHILSCWLQRCTEIVATLKRPLLVLHWGRKKWKTPLGRRRATCQRPPKALPVQPLMRAWHICAGFRNFGGGNCQFEAWPLGNYKLVSTPSLLCAFVLQANSSRHIQLYRELQANWQANRGDGMHCVKKLSSCRVFSPHHPNRPKLCHHELDSGRPTMHTAVCVALRIWADQSGHNASFLESFPLDPTKGAWQWARTSFSSPSTHTA